MIFDGCDYSSMEGYAHRIIWNMPDVTNLKMDNVRIYGTILAPLAKVIGGHGNLQGQLIVKSFEGPFQIDWVKFVGCLPDIEDTPEEPEPEEPQPEEPQPEEPEPEEPEPEEPQPEEPEPVEPEPEEPEEPEESETEELIEGSCSSNKPFGIVSNFGAFTFGDFTAEASDVQGRIGCKGKLKVSSYAINQEVYGTNRYKCNESPLKEDFQYAVVAGTVDIQNSGLSNGGIAYTDNADNVVDYIKNDIINNGCKFVKDSSIVNFDKAEEKMTKLTQTLANMEDNGVVCIYISINII